LAPGIATVTASAILPDEGADLLHHVQPFGIVDAREGLADVESLAVPVVLAVVRVFEVRVRPELAGQEARRQRHAGDHRDPTPPRLPEKQFGGPLPDDVEDDLDACNAGIVEGLQPFLDPLHTDAVVPDLAGLASRSA